MHRAEMDFGIDKLKKKDARVCKQLISDGHLKELDEFFNKTGAIINTCLVGRCEGEMTFPLHWAAQVKPETFNLSIVTYLISKGADCNSFDSCGYAPIHHAAELVHIDAVKVLLEAGADVNIQTHKPTGIVRSLPVTPVNSCALHLAFKGQRDKHASLSERPRYNENVYALHIAQKGKSDKDRISLLVQILLSHGADTNVFDDNGYVPLHCAAEVVNIHASKSLIEAGADVNIQTQLPPNDSSTGTSFFIKLSPLHLALRGSGDENEKTLLVQTLISHEAKCDCLDGCGSAPLHFAASFNNVGATKALLEYGADVNIITQPQSNYSSKRSLDVKKSTPLHVALRFTKSVEGKALLVKTLMSHGADSSLFNSDGYAPLHYAAENCNINGITALLQAGADVNIRTQEPETFQYGNSKQINSVNLSALHLVLRKWNYKKETKSLVQILLSHGADCNFFDVQQHTPVHNAVSVNDTVLVDMLLVAGGDINIHSQNHPMSDDLVSLHDGAADISIRHRRKFVGAPTLFLAHDLSMLKFLLSRNADPNMFYGNGNILHWSVMEFRSDITMFLVSDMPRLLQMKNDRKISPLAVAVKKIIDCEKVPFRNKQDKQDQVTALLKCIHLMLKSQSGLVTELVKSPEWNFWMEQLTFSSRGVELLTIIEDAAYHPRSLLDLCIIQIRDSLQNSSRSIAEAVVSLPLPTKMKEKLKLTEKC